MFRFVDVVIIVWQYEEFFLALFPVNTASWEPCKTTGECFGNKCGLELKFCGAKLVCSDSRAAMVGEHSGTNTCLRKM